MATPSNTFTTASAKGIREDLSDVISRIDPTEVPFQANIGKGTCKSTRFDWQIQSLTAADADNANLEGDDATTDAATATSRVWNYTQISDKVARVSGTLDAVDKAGRDSELSYQVLLKGLEIRRDMEKRLVGNYASVASAATVAGKTAGFEAWLTTNDSRGATATQGGFNSGTGLVAAASNGTLRQWTESMLADVHQAAYTAGGRPTMLMVPPALKRRFSAFAGVAQLRKEAAGEKQATIIGGADVYVGDFGSLTTTTNLFMSTRSALLVDPKMAKVRYLRPMKNVELAKTGDSERRQILVEYGLEVSNEAAHGVVADIQAAAVT